MSRAEGERSRDWQFFSDNRTGDYFSKYIPGGRIPLNSTRDSKIEMPERKEMIELALVHYRAEKNRRLPRSDMPNTTGR